MYDIIIGRDEADKEKLGLKGTVFLGKHYVKMGQTTSLSNSVYFDMLRSHVMLVVGKRGSGKSYLLSVIAEGMADLEKAIKQNISIILLDTMGVFWSMKYPNKHDATLLKEWKLDPKGFDTTIYTPADFHKEYQERGVPTDKPFSIKPSELTATDWIALFSISPDSDVAVLLEKKVDELDGQDYDLDQLIKAVMADKDFEQRTKQKAKNLLNTTKSYGLFSKEGTPLKELAKGGQVSVLDLSCYATLPDGWTIKNLVVGIIAKRLFLERMKERKQEEYEELEKTMNPYTFEGKEKQDYPLVWLVLDEAHEFLPVTGKTLATDPLVTILREGRQPGISLILASQQPGKIHTDVMTQSDTVVSLRITAKLDTDALGMLMQSYMRKGLVEELDHLPRSKGSAIVFDDTNEKMYPIKIRPKFSWHGGGSPSALREQNK
ncbi:MAG: ATP-binding protein [Candidatus Woesearchaeota archaeon]|nr:MAG: ATP-binding protein [Candidatus Woesearchaeota archaeon]